MVKELTPQLDRQLPSELEGVWIQVVDRTRYDEKCAAAKQVVDSKCPSANEATRDRVNRRRW